MDFFNAAIDTMQTLVIALGAGLGVWGIINLLEGYAGEIIGTNPEKPMNTGFSPIQSHFGDNELGPKKSPIPFSGAAKAPVFHCIMNN